MADKKISDLPAASSVAGTDIVPVVSGGVTKQATVTQLLAGGGGSTSPAGSSGDLQINTSGAFGALTPGTGVATFLAAPSGENLGLALLTPLDAGGGGTGLNSPGGYGNVLTSDGAGNWTSSAPPASGSTPTGTGLRKVAAGVEAGAAALLVNADVDAAASVAFSKLGGGAQTLPAVTTFISTVDASAFSFSREPVSAQTTALTTTVLAYSSVSGMVTTCLVASYVVCAIKSDGTVGGSWSVSASFRVSSAGALSQLGSALVTPIGTPDDAALAPTCDASGTNIRLTVPGKASATFRWGMTGSVLAVTA